MEKEENNLNTIWVNPNTNTSDGFEKSKDDN